MTETKTRAPKAPTVAVDGKVQDGKGGFFKQGDKLEGVSKDTIASLKAKGYV